MDFTVDRKSSHTISGGLARLQPSKKMIYVLILEQGKFYVGYTGRPLGERVLEHFRNQGSRWTSLYPPVQVLQFQEGGLEEENELTLQMTYQYGWWNVRGGSWCQVDMNSCPPALLEWQGLALPNQVAAESESDSSDNEEDTFTNGCFRCGFPSHFARDCYAKRDVNGYYLSR